ncbi:unnamed protein product [Clonostachys rosea f. rosea IK726]|uniref:Uncharacterized protein n=1 Tax=Clonostachys rosea f. rosea IK726 TaxID=1349383 RepID=A0ACA9U475_BIOOC|nr:unnamed protein product [Clonostachys rosea f. rosea IK726]
MLSDSDVIAGEWTLLSLALMLVCARFYVRLILLNDTPHWADFWVLVAAACGTGLTICDTLIYKAGTMENFSDPGSYTLKVRFLQNYWFDVGMYFPKFSILSFYYELVPPTKPRIRKLLYVLIAFTVACSLVTFLDATFWCRADIASNWSEDPDACSAFNSMTMMRIHWSMNFSTEVFNVIFPFPILRDLKLRKPREKIGLGVIFGLGLLTISVSIGRFINMATQGNNFDAYLWASSELYVSIMVVSSTALRPLLRKISHIANPNQTETVDQSILQTKSGGLRMETGESRPTGSPHSGLGWRAQSGKTDAEAGSQVELGAESEMSYVIVTEEIQASTAGKSENPPANETRH